MRQYLIKFTDKTAQKVNTRDVDIEDGGVYIHTNDGKDGYTFYPMHRIHEIKVVED